MNSTDNEVSVKKSRAKKAPEKRSSAKKKAVVKTVLKKAGKRKTAGNKSISEDNRVEPEQCDKSNNIVLAPVMMINDVKSLCSKLERAIATNDQVSVDASSVEMIDTAMFQLLLTFSNKIESQKKKINWLGLSSEFMNRAEALNISEELGLVRNADG